MVKAPPATHSTLAPTASWAASASGSRAAQPPGPLPQDALTLLPGTSETQGGRAHRKLLRGPQDCAGSCSARRTQGASAACLEPGSFLLAELMQLLVLGAGVGWTLLVPATRVPSFSFFILKMDHCGKIRNKMDHLNDFKCTLRWH